MTVSGTQSFSLETSQLRAFGRARWVFVWKLSSARELNTLCNCCSCQTQSTTLYVYCSQMKMDIHVWVFCFLENKAFYFGSFFFFLHLLFFCLIRELDKSSQHDSRTAISSWLLLMEGICFFNYQSSSIRVSLKLLHGHMMGLATTCGHGWLFEDYTASEALITQTHQLTKHFPPPLISSHQRVLSDATPLHLRNQVHQSLALFMLSMFQLSKIIFRNLTLVQD